MADSWRSGHKRKAGDASFYGFEDDRVHPHSNTRYDPGAGKHTQYSHRQGPPAQYRPRSASATRRTVEQRGLFRPRSLSPATIPSIQRSLSGSSSPNNAHRSSGTATSTHIPQRQQSPAGQKSSDSHSRGSPELGEASAPLFIPPLYLTASENLQNRKAMRGGKTQQQPRSNNTQAPDEDEISNPFNKHKPEHYVPSIIRESKLRKALERAPSPELLYVVSPASSSASPSPASIPQPQRHFPFVPTPASPTPRRPMASTAPKPIITYSKAQHTTRKQPAATALTAAHPTDIPPTSSASQTTKPLSQDGHRGPELASVGTSSPEHAIARSESPSSRTLHDSPHVASVFLDERLLERAHHVTVTTTATSTSVSYDLLPVGGFER